MTYQLTNNGLIKIDLSEDSAMYLPSEDNGTSEWREYKKWLDEGNTPLPPDPTPEPEPLTPEQKLQNAGLTVEELKSLLGL